MIIVTPSFGKMFSGFEERFQKSCFVMNARLVEGAR